MSLHKIAAAAAVVAVGTWAHADLVVNLDLGALGVGNHAFSGTTVGQPNNADTYAPLGNPAAIWDQEFVYQFTINQPMTIGVTTNDPNGAIDNDFFLLNSLSTVINANGLRQATAVHNNLVEVSGVFGNYGAGTYYLSIDAWRGNPSSPGTPPTGRAGPFSGTLNLTAFNPGQPPAATQTFLGGSVTGTLGAGEIHWYRFDYSGSGGFILDTEGSTLAPSNDTELGLYDSLGNLIISDDDGGTGLLSLIVSPTGLPAGTYYLAFGGFNTTFNTGFNVTSTSTNTGAYVINGIAIPEPAGLALLGVAGLLALRRCRRDPLHA